MQKEVLVSISGNYAEEDEGVQVLVPGQYYKKNESHYLFYEQYDEESKTILKNTIKIKDDTVEMKKTGAMNVHMYFKKDSNYTSYYDMNQGAMLMETRTGNVQVIEEEDSLTAHLNYELYLNQQYAATCSVSIKVVERSIQNEE